MTAPNTIAEATDWAATVKAIATSGLPMPWQIQRVTDTPSLTFKTYAELEAWSEQLTGRFVFDDRTPSAEDPRRLITWHIGQWSGFDVSLWAHEDAPAGGAA